MKSRMRKRGYTLVEIMVAVIAIGILTSIAIPSWVKTRNASRSKDAAARLEMIAAAVRQLTWDTGCFPGGLDLGGENRNPEIWDLTTADAGLLSADEDFKSWKGPYIPEVPKDPWGHDYFFDPDYRIDGVNRVVVGSFGPNGSGRNVYDSDNVYVILE